MFIFDATPLIYLAKSEKLEKVAKLEEEKAIPEKVYKEVVENSKGEPDAQRIEKQVKNGKFKIQETEVEKTVEGLSQADLQVLKIAEEENATAIMDEENGRNLAKAKGVQTRGTAFIALKTQKKGIITEKESKNIIDEMIDQGWYCSTDLYKEIIRKIEMID